VERLPSTRRDPFQPPAELRGPPLRPLRLADGHAGWLVTGHALARRVLADPRFTASRPHALVGDPARDRAVSDAAERMPEAAGALLGLDGPAHTRVRRALARYFTVAQVGAYAPAIEAVVRQRLDALARLGAPADLVADYATPVSTLTLCALLGLPEGDRARLERLTALLVDDVAAGAGERIGALRELAGYCRDVAAAKRRAPGPDLLSDLVVRGELNDDEVAGAALDLCSAGHETTSRLLAYCAFFLLADPARARAFRATGPAVEELLRYLTVVPNGVAVAFPRTATADVELDGATIRAGEVVAVSLAAANRDAGRFADPDAYAPGRDARGQLAFGHGRHVCLGQHLARAQLEIALGRLFARFPALRLAVPADEVPVRLALNHRVRALPVAW
jgi:cytochrome P450